MGVHRGVRWFGLAASSLVLAGLTASEAEAFTPPPPNLTCSYSGAPSNTVTFTSGPAEETLIVQRVGEEIKLFSEHFYGWRPKGKRIKWHRILQSPTCNVVPSVRNTDKVIVRTDPDESVEVNLSLEGGPLAPGATTEPDGTSEIETTVQIGYGGPVGFVGGPENDQFRFGTTNGLEGVNLNSQDEAASPDVDATMALAPDPAAPPGLGTALDLAAFTGGGDDTVSTAGGPEFDASFFGGLHANLGSGNDTANAQSSMFTFIKGGSGNDQITGGPGFNVVFGGGGGDTIIGGPKPDEVDPGHGRDVAMLDGGRDIVAAHDGKRDRISCGAQVDFVAKDRKDRTPRCERRYFGSVRLKPFR